MEPPPYDQYDVSKPAVWRMLTEDPRYRPVLLSTHPDVRQHLEEWHRTGEAQKGAEWLQKRARLSVSGSILPSIAGEGYEDCSRWGSGTGRDGWAKTFLCKMQGLRPGYDPQPFRGNEATAHGELHEDTAARLFCERERVYSFGVGLLPFQDPELRARFPYAGGSPDGVTARGEVLEIKCPFRRSITPGQVPLYYQLQPLFYAYMLGLRRDCQFIQYRPGGEGGAGFLDVTVVPYDQARVDAAMARAEAFHRALEACRAGGPECLPREVLQYRRWAARRRAQFSLRDVLRAEGFSHHDLRAEAARVQGELLDPLPDAAFDALYQPVCATINTELDSAIEEVLAANFCGVENDTARVAPQ